VVKISDTAKGCGGLLVVIVAYMWWCYFEQIGNHRWAREVTETMAKVPDARLISSIQGGEIINLVSWFWPADLRLVYARPDITTPEPRFFILSFGREDKEESDVELVAVDCKALTETHYWPTTDGESGESARNVLGEPITAPDGRIYRRHDTHVKPAPEHLKAFCETDWTRERQAAAGH